MFIFMYCACENHTFNVTPTHRLQQHRSFFQQTARIACFFCEGCTWHHLHMLVEEPLCCEWKGRAARAKTFTLWHQFRFIRPRIKHFNKTQHDSNKGHDSNTLWHQATIQISRRAYFISACSRHTDVVHHAHPVRGESHISTQC